VEDVYETPAALFEHAAALAARMAANPPLVVQGVKQVLNAASERAAAESLRTVALWNAAFLPSHDLREAMTAFIEKRAAKFEGR
jgi:enoyl-CoA hydratase